MLDPVGATQIESGTGQSSGIPTLQTFLQLFSELPTTQSRPTMQSLVLAQESPGPESPPVALLQFVVCGSSEVITQVSPLVLHPGEPVTGLQASRGPFSREQDSHASASSRVQNRW